MSEKKLFPTTIVGSYPRPKWLHEEMSRFRKGEISEEQMEKAYDRAVDEVLKEHEQADVDIVSDGEMRRDEMVEHFAARIDGFKFYDYIRVWGNNYFRKSAVVDKVSCEKPMLVDEFNYTKSRTDRRIKVPITGPYTIADWSFNEYYPNKRELVLDLADIIHNEIKELESAGADFIQIDEPALSTHPEDVKLVEEATEIVSKGVKAYTAMHICYGDFTKIYPQILEYNVDQFDLEFANGNYANVEIFKDPVFTKEVGFGVIDVHDRKVETIEQVKQGIRKALEMVEPEKVYVDPDCGLKLLPREIAFEKLKAMVEGTKQMRMELE